MKVFTLTLLFFLIAASEAKQYSRCRLASRLKQGGLDGYYGYNLANWVSKPGSHDYGIFQINRAWWCNNYQGHTTAMSLLLKDVKCLSSEDSIFPLGELWCKDSDSCLISFYFSGRRWTARSLRSWASWLLMVSPWFLYPSLSL
uniref:lysozyme n=1 Tax=Laticauda laticaudata TaxID=8630 RepID=A0A8C5SXE3_LATLA